MTAPTTTVRRTAWTVFGLYLALVVAAIAVEVLITLADARGDNLAESAATIAAVLVTGVFGVTGIVIARRLPTHPIGWLMLSIGLLFALQEFSHAYVRYALVVDPGALPNPRLLVGAEPFGSLAIGLTGTFLVLLFPDGRLPSRRWRVVAWLSALSLVGISVGALLAAWTAQVQGHAPLPNPFAVEALQPAAHALQWLGSQLPLCVLACVVSVVVRFRRAQGAERQQIRWLATAAAVSTAMFVAAAAVAVVGTVAGMPNRGLAELLWNGGLVTFLFVPIAIAVAVLRYRLYEIDVVINKAVVYGTLAVFITAVYASIVVGVGRLVGGGDRPNLALSIAATAVVAVAFQPVRERVQRVANRLVYGQRATPYEVLSEFADRVGGSYDAAELLPMMARTVGQGVGAERVGIWLATGGGLEREATWPSEAPDTSDAASVRDLEHLRGDRMVPIRHRGELLGALTVVKAPGETLTPAEEKLLEDVSAQAGLVLRNVRLIEDLRSSRQRLVRAQDEERRRLERNLHDGAQQSLVAVALMIRMIRARLDADSMSVGEILDEAADQLSAAIDELRMLARGIHPVILSERGLGPAITSLAERSPVPVVVDYQLDERPPVELEATSYYVVAEALTNVAKHAHATEVDVKVTRSDTELLLEVSDDGVGGCDRTRGTGILALADRVSVVDGTLVISSPPGQGTRFVCRLPLPLSVRPTDVAPAQHRPTQPLGAVQ